MNNRLLKVYLLSTVLVYAESHVKSRTFSHANTNNYLSMVRLLRSSLILDQVIVV